MAFCLNPDCPHKKKTGYPAEFREGITHCSDCGSLLSEEVIEKEDTQKTSSKITLADLHKRILYTIGFVLLWRVLLFIPAPGIDLHALGSFFNHVSPNSLFIFFGLPFDRVSILSLGIMPYLSTYMIVEILSMFIQPLKAWRAEGYSGRVKIKKVALLATFLLALWQGYGVAHGLEGLVGTVGEKIVRNPGLSSRLVLTLTLTAGTFLTIWIAGLITKKGIGHGISILMLAGFGRSILSNISMIISVPHERSLLEYFLLFVLIVAALIFLIVFMEKGKRKIPVRFNDSTEAHIPLKLTSAGIMPVEWTSSLIALPITISGFINSSILQKLSEVFSHGHILYYILYIIILLFLYYLFTSFFYDTKMMATLLKSKQATIISPREENGESYIDKNLEAMIPIGALYLCFFVFVPHVISRFLIFHLGGIELIIAAAIFLDLMEEVRMRRKGSNLLKVAELHDVPMAGLLKSLFKQKGLPCYLRGYYHRALLYFFGPYIEISVLVPEDRMIDAKEVIENYLDSNILTVQSGKVSEFP